MALTHTVLSLVLALSLITSCTSKDQKKFVTEGGTTIVTKNIEYSSGGKTMNGYLAMPQGEGPFPGVLVVHEWWGQTDYPRQRARQLAQAGYAAFAVDMYGEGKTVSHPDDAKTFSSQVMKDLDGAEASFRAAIKSLKEQDKVNGEKIAAIGYCFGGAVVLEMARRGVDLDMVASFHGNLSPLVENEVPPMQTRILIFNGAADPFVPEKALKTVSKKLKESKVRYKLVNFKGAKHGFTNPEATAKGEEFKLPLAYNERADKKSWEQTLNAFKVVFK